MKTYLFPLLFALLFLFSKAGFAQVTFADSSSTLVNSSLSSGVAMGIADMNADGLDDIIRLSNASNLEIEYQGADGIWTNYDFGNTGPSNEWSMCISDVDENGYNDVLVGGAYNNLKLLKANDAGTSLTSETLPGPNIFLQGSNFADIDNDGFIDIFACHDEGISSPYKNDGLGGFAYDLGLINTASTIPSDNSGNYGSTWTDYDGDGDLDLYISKCRLGVGNPLDGRRVNLLFQNDGNNNYTDVAEAAGLRPLAQSWSADFSDIDNDGDLDAFIINHDIPSQLFSNNGDGTFTDITIGSGLEDGIDDIGLGIQCKFEDFDNDGFVDLLVTGRSGSHRLFWNNGDITFTASDPFETDGDGIQSAAVGDLDHDGFIDVIAGFANGYNSPSSNSDRYFRNEGNTNNFFNLQLTGVASNINGVGALVEIYGLWGKQIREIRAGESYGVFNSFTAHFGLGTSTEVDSVIVRWPSGVIDTIYTPAINTFIQLTEGVLYDCPDLDANIGDACDDGNPDTENDEISADCQCEGTLISAAIASLKTLHCGGQVIQITGAQSGSTAGGVATSETRTIYAYVPDGDGGEPTYVGGAWPFVVLTGTLDIDPDISAVLTTNANGVLLVNGWPAYQFIGDASPDDAIGTFGPWYYFTSNGDQSQDACPPVFDCPELSLNIGDPCDDGNPNTDNDTVTEDCACEGILVFDCPELAANIGDSCDDGNPDTENDVITADCQCEGSPILLATATLLTLDCGGQVIQITGAQSGTTDGGIATSDTRTIYAFLPDDGGGIPLYLGLDWPFVVLTGTLNIDTEISAVLTTNADDILLVNGWPAYQFVGDSSPDDATGTFGPWYYFTSNGDQSQDACPPVFDCPDLSLNIGDACDDGNPNTENDTVSAECECSGETIYAPLTGNADWNSACGSRDMTIAFYELGTSSLVDLFNTSMASDGTFSIAEVPVGTYDIFVKIAGNLQKGYPNEVITIGANNLSLGTFIRGDLNGDNGVNIIDLSVVNAAFGSINGTPNYNPLADMNCDNGVNIIDVSILNGSFGMTGDSPGTP